MTTDSKGGYASSLETDSQDLHLQSKVRSLRLMESSRLGLTAFLLLTGVTIMGVSADTMSVYQTTHVPGSFHLPLWPEKFNLQPTVALVVGGAVILVANGISLASSRAQPFRDEPLPHALAVFAPPLVGLAAALIAVAFYYGVDDSSSGDTLLSWTCRWRAVPMMQQPHFGTLCKESRAGLCVAILAIPAEAVVLAIAGWQARVEKHTAAYVKARKDGPGIS